MEQRTLCLSIVLYPFNQCSNREKLTLNDGGIIGLDWCYNNENSSVDEALRPTVLILPGIVGKNSKSFIFSMMLIDVCHVSSIGKVEVSAFKPQPDMARYITCVLLIRMSI